MLAISRFFRTHTLKFVSAIFVFLFFVAYFFESMFVYIYPGQAGLLFRSLSETPFQSKSYKEGLYSIAPWNKMYIYDLTKQLKTLDVVALTSNGLTVNVRVSSIFHPIKDELAELTLHVGKDYINKILVPTIVSSAKEVIGNYLPENLYTTDMHVIQEQILQEAKRELKVLPITIETVVVEEIELPKSINQAIEHKLKHQQEGLAYEYILKRELDEAKRRKIEAESVKAYNEVIKSSLNKEVLQWLRIKSVAELTQTKNSKVIVMDTEVSSVPVTISTADK
ncbi:MAG: prohibitin family protein [Gammaproteobacteria bacterium]|nr:prohibitin family protein [Gammaproteobacteria bacterium]